MTAILPPAFEAVIRSPLGEVRVWIESPAQDETDAIGQPVRTSVRLDYGETAEREAAAHTMARVVGELSRAVRGLTGVGLGGNVVPDAAGLASIGPWLLERTESDPASRTLIRYLYEDYLAWCDRRALAPLTRGDFGKALDQRGYGYAGNIHQGGLKGRARGGLRIRLGEADAAERLSIAGR